MKLAIISEKTRYHFQKPLDYFTKIEITHLYKTTYSDSRLNNKNLVQYKNIFQLYSKLKKISPDIIQGMEPYYGYSRFRIPVRILPIFIITYLYSKLHKTPYFFNILENIPPERKYGKFFGKIMKSLARIYTKNAFFIFYLNNGARKNLLNLGVEEQKITFGLWGIWGVDVNEFKPVSNPQKRLMYIGSLSEQKGILDLITAVALVKKKISNIKLCIIGTGFLENEVKRLISDLKLGDVVTSEGEVLSNKIADYLADSYLLVAPSLELKYWSEQVGMMLIEAMACGIPVISTKTGSIPEFVLNNKTGILIEASKPEKLAKAIAELWNNKKIHTFMKQNGRKYVLGNYNAKVNVSNLEKEIIKRYENR